MVTEGLRLEQRGLCDAGNLSDAVLHQLLFQDPVEHINILGNVRPNPYRLHHISRVQHGAVLMQDLNKASCGCRSAMWMGPWCGRSSVPRTCAQRPWCAPNPHSRSKSTSMLCLPHLCMFRRQ